MPKVYVASPLGFAESTRNFMTILENRLDSCGYTVLSPWSLAATKLFDEAKAIDDPERRRYALHEANTKVASKNEEAIRECDLVVAVLDGVDVDSGTASEIGFACALGKPIYGYRGDTRRAGDNEGSTVNLQVEYWIESSGGRIFTDLGVLCQHLEHAPIANGSELRAS